MLQEDTCDAALQRCVTDQPGLLRDYDPAFTDLYPVSNDHVLMTPEVAVYGSTKPVTFRPVMYVRGNPIYFYGETVIGPIMVYRMDGTTPLLVTDVEGFLSGDNKPVWEKRIAKRKASTLAATQRKREAMESLAELMADGQLDAQYMHGLSLTTAMQLLQKSVIAGNGAAFKTIITDLAKRLQTGERVEISRKPHSSGKAVSSAERMRKYRAKKKAQAAAPPSGE